MTRRFAFAILVCTLLSACSQNNSTLTVRVITGLVPGPEFRTVQTEVLFDSPSSTRQLVSSEAVARYGVDYARGHDVASHSLPHGDYRVRVRLLRSNGSFLVERTISVNLAGDTVLPVHITRDCVGVVCPVPGGVEAESTCLAGRCVDPRCTAASPQFCPTVAFCNDVSACRETAECATQECVQGVCTPQSVPGSCDDTQWCNPDLGAGCEPLDRTVPDTGIVCGTICTVPTAPCRFGYWNCADASAPFCEDLTNRPIGFVCGPTLTCDAAGDCVHVTPVTPAIEVMADVGLLTSERGDSVTFTLTLSSQPLADVVVGVASSDETEGIVDPTELRFTPDNWNSPHEVTVVGVDDALIDGEVSYTVITALAVSADANYNGLNAADVSVGNIDDESAGVTVSGGVLRTSEAAGTDTFTIVLNAQPSAPVTIEFASDSPSEASVFPSSVTFTVDSWAADRTITVTGVDDAVRDGDASFVIITSATISDDPNYDGLDVDDPSGTNTDDERLEFVITPMSGLTTSEAGGFATFQISLPTTPSRNTRVSFTSLDTSEGSASSGVLLFSAGAEPTPRLITISGVDDSLVDGDQPYIVQAYATSADADYNGLTVDIAVVNLDNDSAAFDVVADPLQTSESGATSTLTISLRSQPADDVHFTVSSTDVTEGTVSPSSLTFTPADWSTPQTVTVQGVDDGLADRDQYYDVVVAVASSADPLYAALSDQRVTLLNYDNESASVTVTPTSGLTTDERGATASFTMQLTAQPESDVTIGLTSSDISEGTVLPSSVTFTSGDWNVPQLVTVTGANDAIADGDIAYTIITSQAMSASEAYDGVNVPDVSVTNVDVLPFVQQAYVKASNPDPGDNFGSALALSADGNTMTIGAYTEQSLGVGVGAGQADNSGFLVGAVYIYTRAGAVWTQQAYVKASNSATDAGFGMSISLSSNGDTLVVSAPRERSNATGINGNQADQSNAFAGAAYVFTRSGSTWTQQAYIKASNTGFSDRFGSNVRLAADGDTLAVSAYDEGSNSPGIGGDQSNNGATGSGAVYIFVRSGGVWTQQVYIKSSNPQMDDQFGYGMALAADGTTLAVGAQYEASAAVGVGGNQADNTAYGAGAVYVFTRAGVVWTQQAYVKASNTNGNDRFGSVVALSADGNRMAVSAPLEASNAVGVGGDQLNNVASNSGAVYVFNRVGTTWTQDAYVKASNTAVNNSFGAGLALSGDGSVLVVGAIGEGSHSSGVNGSQTNTAYDRVGAGYAFTRASGSWVQYAYLKSSNPATEANFGAAMGISTDGSTIVIGAPRESGGSPGVNGDQSNQSLTYSGAAYVFLAN
ncbi:MAG: hypothetical protein IPK60_11510 [Sandaracinaceae bacterium]|nr:hypothetical protein [Sandaracinaceae bacterium]